MKLRAYNILNQVIDWIETFIKNRTFYVTVEGIKSEEGRACSGVPQGSVIGPLLFLVFINDLASIIKSPCYMFADDVKVVGNPTTHVLQSDLNHIYEWTQAWHLPLNVNKCHRLTQTPDISPLTLGPIPNPKILPAKTEVRDLGVQISSKFTLTAQCQAAAKKARKAL